MKNIYSNNIYKHFSKKRIDGYVFNLGSPTNKSVLAHYIWNMKLCESFYPVLHICEVVLRNTINKYISQEYNKSWITNHNILKPNEFKISNKIRGKLRYNNKSYSNDNIVSELTFGFWTRLFNSPYKHHIWNKKNMLKNVFPNMPKKIRTPEHIGKKVNLVRDFRNRIFHHEPIWKHNLKADYNNILNIISWMDPSISKLTENFNCFNSTEVNGLRQINMQLNDIEKNNLTKCTDCNGMICRCVSKDPKVRGIVSLDFLK